MADHANEDHVGDVYIYRGGRAPQHIIHARIDTSVDEIEEGAFEDCENLLTVDTHDGIRRVGARAFKNCISLRHINLKLAVEIGHYAFDKCENLESVEFGDRLETIGNCAFRECTSLEHLKLPSIVTIGRCAFWSCERLIDIELSKRLELMGRSAFRFRELMGRSAFRYCTRLQCIAVPLKRDLFEFSQAFMKYNQFDDCEQLTTFDLLGGIHKIIASLHMESWRAEMTAEIKQINQVLPNTPADNKTTEIRQWMHSVLDKMDHYKAEHHRYVKEGMTLLELAVWKTKLGEKEDYAAEGRTKKAKVDAESYRRDKRITCGADTVIKNVLPFLQLE